MEERKAASRSRVVAAALAVTIMLAASEARASDESAPARDLGANGPVEDAPGGEPDRWRFTFIPYGWATGIDGNVSHPQLPVNVRAQASFGDVLENLDLGGMATLEARKGRFGVLIDAIYARSSGDGSLTSLPTVPVVLPIGVAVEAEAENASVLGALQYRLAENGGSSLDLLAGARYWSVETELAYAIPAAIPLPPQPPVPRQYSAEFSRTWVDATVGVKGQLGIAPRLNANAWLIYGGGGSDGVLDIMASLQYRLSRGASLFLGYRWLDIKYVGSRGFRYDVELHGPGLGLGLHF